jgi:hypothetical protein
MNEESGQSERRQVSLSSFFLLSNENQADDQMQICFRKRP